MPMRLDSVSKDSCIGCMSSVHVGIPSINSTANVDKRRCKPLACVSAIKAKPSMTPERATMRISASTACAERTSYVTVCFWQSSINKPGYKRCCTRLSTGATREPERDDWVTHYFEVLARGFAAQASPHDGLGPRKRRGRLKQSAAKNLLDVLLWRGEQILDFLDDLSLPFTNNQGERDLRMIKMQQKISGCFCSEEGASAFCSIRSYISTMRKQGHPILAALTDFFFGSSFPIAWSPE